VIIGRRETWIGRSFLIALMAVTVVPFVSLFVTALHPSGSYPEGLQWPDDPQWGNFVEAFRVSNMSALLRSSALIAVAVVPVAVFFGTMAGFAIGHLQIAGRRAIFVLFVFGLTLP
jgi:raffinose/stachyose/melibiose transport system permease protein